MWHTNLCVIPYKECYTAASEQLPTTSWLSIRALKAAHRVHRLCTVCGTDDRQGQPVRQVIKADCTQSSVCHLASLLVHNTNEAQRWQTQHKHIMQLCCFQGSTVAQCCRQALPVRYTRDTTKYTEGTVKQQCFKFMAVTAAPRAVATAMHTIHKRTVQAACTLKAGALRQKATGTLALSQESVSACQGSTSSLCRRVVAIQASGLSATARSTLTAAVYFHAASQCHIAPHSHYVAWYTRRPWICNATHETPESHGRMQHKMRMLDARIDLRLLAWRCATQVSPQRALSSRQG
jgi:hypothetical protein